MIKYFTTGKTTDDRLNTIKGKCSTNKYTGLVVSRDRRKIYYQPSDSTSGFSISQTEFLTKTSLADSSPSLGILLEGEMKYLHDASTNNFYVKNSYFGAKDGDTIQLYIINSATIKITTTSVTNVLFNQRVNVGDNSAVLIKLVYYSGAWSAYLAGGGGALTFDVSTWANVSANWNTNKSNGQAVAASAIYYSVSGLLKNQKFWDDTRYYFNGSILTGSQSVPPSTLPLASNVAYANDIDSNIGSQITDYTKGATTLIVPGTGCEHDVPPTDPQGQIRDRLILTGYFDTVSGTLAGHSIAHYVQRQKWALASALFDQNIEGNPQESLYLVGRSFGNQTYGQTNWKIRSAILPSATTTAYGITQLNGNYTSATVSGSDLPWQASAAYKFISGALDGLNIEDKTSAKLSAVTINGTKHYAVSNSTDGPGVANLGIMSTQINGKIYGANTNNLINLGQGYVVVSGSPTVGQYVRKTATGYETAPGIASLSGTKNITGTWNATSNYTLDVGGDAIPVMIRTGAGNMYPVEKGTVAFRSNDGHFTIDTRPYMAYDNTSTWNGPWTIYYGAGINDLYTTANTVTGIAIDSATTSYNILFGYADVYTLTVAGTGNLDLTIPAYNASSAPNGLPAGHGMIIKIINNGGRVIKLGTRTLITSAGTYSFSVFNFGNGVEQVGEVTQVYS